MRHQYNLGFISDEALFEHVRGFVSHHDSFSMFSANKLCAAIAQTIMGGEQQDGWLWNAERKIIVRFAETATVGKNDVIRILDKLIRERDAVCYWVNMGATESMDTAFQHDGKPIERTQAVSWDVFFTHITGDPEAFAKLSMALANEMSDLITKHE